MTGLLLFAPLFFGPLSLFFSGKNGFFSGDSLPIHRLRLCVGHHRHFGQIRERLGPFDATMVEIGAYNQAWRDDHMGPEQALIKLEINRKKQPNGGRSAWWLHASAWWTRDLGGQEPSKPSALSRTLSSVPKKELCEVLAGHVITLRQTVAETEPETRRLRNPQRW